jgi:hypothetical protein
MPVGLAVVKMFCQQSQPVLKLGTPAGVILEQPHWWGAWDVGDSGLSPV